MANVTLRFQQDSVAVPPVSALNPGTFVSLDVQQPPTLIDIVVDDADPDAVAVTQEAFADEGWSFVAQNPATTLVQASAALGADVYGQFGKQYASFVETTPTSLGGAFGSVLPAPGNPAVNYTVDEAGDFRFWWSIGCTGSSGFGDYAARLELDTGGGFVTIDDTVTAPIGLTIGNYVTVSGWSSEQTLAVGTVGVRIMASESSAGSVSARRIQVVPWRVA